jgi:hypothetical protein
MSTSPDNHLVNVLSQWLARHVDDAELQRELETVDTSQLAPEQAHAVDELRAELSNSDGAGDLEMVVRETLEAVALG